MSFYGNLAATADRLLRKFGAAATLAVRTSGAYDPATGESGVTVTNYAITAVVFDVRNDEIDGALIRANDQRAYISTLPAIPLPGVGDQVIWQGVTYQIAPTDNQSEPAVKNLAPGGTALLYEAILRR